MIAEKQSVAMARIEWCKEEKQSSSNGQKKKEEWPENDK